MNYFIAKPFFPFSRLIICTSFPRQKQKSPTVKTIRSIPSTYLARKKKEKKKRKENPSYLRAQESPEFSFTGYSRSRIGFFALPCSKNVELFFYSTANRHSTDGMEESIGVDTEFS